MPKNFHIYIPFEKFEKELEAELKSFDKYKTYYISEKKMDCIWAQDILFDVQEIKIESIKDGSQKLKKIHSHWAPISLEFHRRTQLIQEQTNFFKQKQFDFLSPLPKIKLGVWLLRSENTIWASSTTKHPIPGGKVEFKEDKDIPPSRAYLKLWELFTIHQIKPNENSKVIDMGACPGGWSWVLANMGCSVLSVDKAELDPKVLENKNITFLAKDAFKLEPESIGALDWFFSDIICEPPRLLELVDKWQDYVQNFVCTIKYKGATDFETTRKFLSKEGSKIYHLYNNKHEVTWIWQK